MITEKEIIDSLKTISDGKQKIKTQLNYVRQAFKKKYPNSTDVTLKYSVIIPSIWVFHKSNGKSAYTHCRQFLFSASSCPNPIIIEKIYSQIYDRVSLNYKSLIKFALEKAKNLKKQKIFTQQAVNYLRNINRDKLMFYCCEYKDTKGEVIGFSIFCKGLMNIEFDSVFVKKCKEKYPYAHQDFLDLLDEYYPLPKQTKTPPTVKKQTYNNQNKQQKTQSNNQYSKYNQKQTKYVSKYEEKYQQTPQRSTKYKSREEEAPRHERQENLEQKLKKIMNKNLQKYQNKLDEMYDELDGLRHDFQQGKFISEEEMDNLDQEIYEFEKRLENFKSTIKHIKSNQSQNRLKGNYKMAVIAEKQLDSKLPIIARKAKIMALLQKNDLIILQGETGSGKSTQLPQFLCEYFNLFDDPRALPVLITQPRKLAARTLAERVAFELQQNVGGFVDYVDSQAKYESNTAKIIFKLDRLALDDLIEDDTLKNYSCLVLDQAHERTINIDVIIGLVNKVFSKIGSKRDFKVIITSASMDVQLFQDYFKEHGIDLKYKTVKVPGRMYPVKISYKDYHSLKDSTRKIQKVIDEEIIVYDDEMKRELQGNILVFCTNIDEINQLVDKYTKKLSSNVFKVFPLHGKLSSQQQSQIFKKTKQYKLIFATRMAQTAITIDGVTVVVDPGEDMKKVYDQTQKISSMRLMKISQSTAKQRAGRAGRTSKGFCFRLYSQKFLETCPPNQTPQIQNQSLQMVVLRLKQLKLKNLSKFQFLSPPSPQGLQISEELLKMIGCLNDENELNSIGRLLVKIPIEPFLSRAIAESLIYESVLRDKYAKEDLLYNLKGSEIDKIKNQPISQSVVEILSMIVNSDHLFYTNQDTREKSDLVKFQSFSQESGDFFYLQNIYNKFMDIYNQTNNEHKIKAFLNKYFLSFKTLKEAKNLNKEIKSVLKKQELNLRFIGDATLQKSKEKIKKCKNYDELVLSCLLSSFCANLCLFSQNQQIGYTLLCQKFPIKIYGTSNLALQGIYPKWIVCHNLTENASGQIYCKIAHEVKEQFFEKQIIEGYIIEKFQINKLIKGNPFYIHKQFQVSTYIWHRVYDAYSKRREFAYFYQFMQKIEILFDQNYSKFTLFIYNSGNKQQKDEIEKFEIFLSSFKKQMDENERFSYLGSCKALFNQQFNIFDIEFNILEYILQFSQLSRQQFNFIYNNCYGYGKLQPISNDNIRIYLDQEKTAQSLKEYLQLYKEYGNFHTKIIKTTKNLNNPDQQILLYFFAGSPSSYQKQIVYLEGYDADTIYEQYKCLQRAVRESEKDKSYHYRISDEIKKITITKHSSSINIQTCLDEYNIEQILHYLVKKQYLPKIFEFPQRIYKERIPGYPQATFTNEQWKKQIHKCLSRYTKEDFLVTVYQVNRRHYNDYSEERLCLCAKVITQDKSSSQLLYSKMNDHLGILGLDKTHVRSRFTILIATVPSEIYRFYEEQLSDTIIDLKSQGCIFQCTFANLYKLNKEFISLILSSSKKEHLFTPLKVIKRMFIPKIVKLSKLQAEIIKNNYSAIMQEIKYNKNAELTFQYDKKILNVYCDETDIKDIKEEFKKIFDERDIKSLFVSYKGKNLNNVLTILKKMQKEYEKDEFFYEIVFMKWGVNLSGKLEAINKCNNLIRQLNEEKNRPCQICEDIIRIPFTLHNCNHTFCWECLTNIIRESKSNSDGEAFQCPYSSQRNPCSTKINYYDVKILFSEEEFRQFCALKVKSHVKERKDMYYMCKNCEQVFEKKNWSASEVSCRFCGSVLELEGEIYQQLQEYIEEEL